ncbi:Uncharacterised protein [Mycolicibacterium vanbaalenii]|uniref:Uncharacterized protein n=1 Tax=Mycolicibacterium vanbaalenii TaxID=110539 RepID=A0A5S9R5W3_MYCVN|nr:Uncharacterised protein [Mycolicibacterium vanbaalenii]
MMNVVKNAAAMPKEKVSRVPAVTVWVPAVTV